MHRGFNLLLRKSKFILFYVSSAAAQSGRWGPLRRYAPAAREVSTGIFYFFSGPETGGDSGDNFLVPDPGPFLVPDPRLFLFCTSHFYILKKDYITGGRGGVLRLKR